MQSDRTKKQKVVALKLIVHLIGDLHQPKHVSTAEDKGENTINYSTKEKEPICILYVTAI
ncbi:S1/P1 nuclease [Mucilaginibacter sp. 21P]|uniref:S1/P1 nuclease n=1 Tax=Mucilaginibacter sp. 21P TaxID=2778902 RepID=UPI00351D6C47